MGAWSHEPFGNDTANDWADELEESSDFSIVEKAFNQIIEFSEEYIDADIACEAYAAAEVLAQALGEGTQDDTYTEKIDAWLTKLTIKPNNLLIPKALRALDLLTTQDSELDELWQDSDEYTEWTVNIDELRELLKAKL